MRRINTAGAPMPELTLFSTAGCHLCEEAQALVACCCCGVTLAVVDIADDPELLAHYGTLIPVLRDEASGRELNWPFGPEDLQDFL